MSANRRKQRYSIALFALILILLLSACSAKQESSSDNKTDNKQAETAADNASKTVKAETTADETAKPDTAEAQPKEIRIGFQIIPNAELLVKASGLAEKKFPDTKITWVQFDSGRDVNTAIASGAIDLGLAGSVPVAIGLANKLPYKVYFLHDIIGDNEALAVRNAAGIQSLADLAGKKIAVPFGSTTHFSLLSALKDAAVDPSKVTILDMQPPDILAAWQRKDIDGAFVWQPTLAKLVADDGKLLTTAKKLAEKGIITADVGIVSDEFADHYPNALKQYVGVLDEAVQLYRTNPDEAAKSVAAFISQPEADTLSQMNELVWLLSSEQREQQYLGSGQGSRFAEVLKQTGEFLVTQQSIPSAPELSVYESGITVDALQP